MPRAEQGAAAGAPRLRGRRLIVTGAASGIGAATARLLALHGARLALWDQNSQSLGQVAEDADAALCTTLDVADEDAVRAAVASSAAALGGGIDGVVNAAGISRRLSAEGTSLADWQRVLDVNLTGPFLVCREAIPWLRRRAGSTIVNVASASALLPVVGNASYVASKGGLIALTKSLAQELGPTIRANVVCPGAVDTPMLPPTLRERAPDPSASPYALQRIGSPEEIAAAILYLSSEESSYTTGAVLAVDGGRSFH